MTSNTLSRLSADILGDVTIQGGNVMRRLLLATLLGIMLSSNIGCFVPIYSATPERRAKQLMFTSEDLRAINEQWERFWFLDQPDHQTPFRTHGGII